MFGTNREPWMAQALCCQVGDDLWFPEKGESTREPKQVCRGCPVRQDCLDFAIENKIFTGIWGGETEHGLRRIARERKAADAEEAA